MDAEEGGGDDLGGAVVRISSAFEEGDGGEDGPDVDDDYDADEDKGWLLEWTAPKKKKTSSDKGGACGAGGKRPSDTETEPLTNGVGGHDGEPRGVRTFSSWCVCDFLKCSASLTQRTPRK